MSKQIIKRMAAWTIVLLLLLGIGRAATSRYEEQMEAFLAGCRAEQKRLGLASGANRKQLFSKYPTPEIALCRTVRLAPGGSGEVVAKGKFADGTKFLLDNDQLELAGESLAGDTYRAEVRVPKMAGPSLATLHALAPVSGGHATCRPAVWIGGKYEWQLTASNGWRIKLAMRNEGFQGEEPDIRKMLREGFPGTKSYRVPDSLYQAEFYRGAETKPFTVRDVLLTLHEAPRSGAAYTGRIEMSEADQQKMSATAAAQQGQMIQSQAQTQAAMEKVQAKYQGEMDKLQQQLDNPKLSDQERQQAAIRIGQIAQKMGEEMKSVMEGRQKSGFEQQMDKEQTDFGCQSLQFRMEQGAVEGSMPCGKNVGTLRFKGAMKFLGP